VERAVAKGLAESGCEMRSLWNHTLYHIDDIPYNTRDLRDLPDGFTPFRNKVEAKCIPRPPLPAPCHGNLPLPRSPPEGLELVPSVECLPLAPEIAALYDSASSAKRLDRDMPVLEGGESAALARLNYYLWDRDLLATYFDSRNGMLGGDYSTKFSSWLSLGCLSPRTVYAECKRYEAERTANKSTYWAVFELIWRDFYRFFCMKHGNRVFLSGGAKGGAVSWKNNPEMAERWKAGQTGIPLVDANMRELAATGFMSNRGRQNVASYLVLDLELDWRIGADWFESLLVDHDVTSNYGNWNAAAGLTGGRVNKFNISKQSRDYDSRGDYIRTWIPELRDVPTQFLFEPWTMPPNTQKSCGCTIGEDYPAPARAQNPGKGGNGKGGGKGGKSERHAGDSNSRKAQNSRDSRDRGWKGQRKDKAAKRSQFEMFG